MTNEIQPNQAEKSTTSTGGFGSALAAFFRGLLRLIVVLLLGGLLGLGIYFGIPYVYQQFILPVQQNTLAVQRLESEQQRLSTQVSQQLADLSSRMQTMETAQDSSREQLSELSSQLSTVNDSLAELSNAGTAAGENLSAVATQVGGLQSNITNLERSLSRQSNALQTQQSQLDTLENQLGSESEPLAALRIEVEKLKAAQILTRARLALARNDIPGAQEEIQTARTVLLGLVTTSPDAEQSGLQAMVTRLDLALQNLESAPLLAAEDVEIAYQLLSGVPQGTVTPVESSLEAAGTATPTATGESSGTATPTATPSPTATP